MAQELKVRISNHELLKRQLLAMGAQFVGEMSFVDTYFKQPKGKVLKISEADGKAILNSFESLDGKFQIVKEEKLADPDRTKAELKAKHGIQSVLKGQREFLALDDLTCTINQIEQVGQFLILTGENPQKSFVEHDLGLVNPEYITVAFNELPTLSS